MSNKIVVILLHTQTPVARFLCNRSLSKRAILLCIQKMLLGRENADNQSKLLVANIYYYRATSIYRLLRMSLHLFEYLM